jgi:hypothetical protein
MQLLCNRVRAGDRGPIPNCFLLPIVHWGIHGKGKTEQDKKMVQFKYEDITFFKKKSLGQLQCLPQNAPANLIATADGATMKLDNQKNGWKRICIYQEANGNNYLCPGKALGRCFLQQVWCMPTWIKNS